MSTEVRQDGSLWVQEYSLVDFVLAIQKHVQEGFVVSLTNEGYPSGFSGHFTVGMVKGVAESAPESAGATEQLVDVPKPTRSKKAATA